MGASLPPYLQSGSQCPLGSYLRGQKGMDPYGEARPGPMIGHTSVNANLASANATDTRKGSNKRQRQPNPRDSGGRF